MFVYLVTNTVNGKRYVGQTTKTLEERWRLHQKVKTGHLLYSAIQKYGVENFTIESICELPTTELLNEFEIEYIKRYCTLTPNGYNLTEGGQAPRMSDETRKRMSESHLGKKPINQHKWTAEERAVRSQVYSGCSNPNAKLTAEQIDEIKRLYSTGDYTQTEVGSAFGVGQSVVSFIVLGKQRQSKLCLT